MAKRLTAAEKIEFATKAKAQAPELARQVRRRVRKPQGGKIHAVAHDITPPSRLQEAATIHEIDHAPEQKNWGRASNLPGIKNPPGMSCKWVRIDHAQRGDGQNLARHLEEGWSICRKSHFPGRSLPTSNLTGHGDYIGNRNTILCFLTERQVAQRKRYFNERRDMATKSVNSVSGMDKARHRAMPMVEDVNETSVTNRRPVSRAQRTGTQIGVAADE